MSAEVDAGLATLSDQLILATVLLYVSAMIAYALDLAFGRSAGASARAAQPILDTAAGSAPVEGGPATKAPPPGRCGRGRWPSG